MRIHGTTKEAPRDRFEREERVTLQPLASHPYRSLVLTPRREERATLHRPVAGLADVAVERRSLTTYSAIEERLIGRIEEVA